MNEMEKLLQNEELLKGLVEAETVEELATLFKQHNIELEEDVSIEDAFQMIKQQNTDELAETDLDDVSGGSISLAVGLGAVGCFVLGAAALSFLGGYASQKYKNWKKRR